MPTFCLIWEGLFWEILSVSSLLSFSLFYYCHFVCHANLAPHHIFNFCCFTTNFSLRHYQGDGHNFSSLHPHDNSILFSFSFCDYCIKHHSCPPLTLHMTRETMKCSHRALIFLEEAYPVIRLHYLINKIHSLHAGHFSNFLLNYGLHYLKYGSHRC